MTETRRPTEEVKMEKDRKRQTQKGWKRTHQRDGDILYGKMSCQDPGQRHRTEKAVI